MKLCQSSSISGPTEILKPIFSNISMMLLPTLVRGCKVPNVSVGGGSVRSSVSCSVGLGCCTHLFDEQLEFLLSVTFEFV